MSETGMMMETHQESLKQDRDQKMTFQVFKIALIATIGGFLFGYNTAIVSGAMIYIKDSIQGSNQSLSYSWQEGIISITILSAWIFSMIAGSCADKFGRKKVILASAAFYALGAIVMGAAMGKWTLLMGRFVAGAGVGLASMVIPTYIAEISPVNSRGVLVTTNNLFITGGQFFSAVLAGFVSMTGIETIGNGSYGWRIMVAFPIVPATIQLIGMFFVPESPRWLVLQGEVDQARIVLQQLRGSEADVTNELESMKKYENCELEPDCSEKESKDAKGEEEELDQEKDDWMLIKVIKDTGLRKALIVGSMLQAIAQLAGINTVMYYSATIITMSGIHDKSIAVWLSAITAGVNFATGFIGMYLVERIGRRLLTLVSLLGVVTSLCILAMAFYIGENNSPGINELSKYRGDNLTSGLVDRCAKYSTCQGCISDPACGHCFHDIVDGNGSCLAADKFINYGRSHFDKCSNGSDISINQVWGYDWCPSKYSWMTLPGLCLYLLFFGPGMGPMPWTINSEIFPTWCRGVCYSTTTSFNWFFNFLVSYTFLSLTQALTKQGAFLLYATFGLVGLIFFYFNLPETKGKSLEETASLFKPIAKSQK